MTLRGSRAFSLTLLASAGLFTGLISLRAQLAQPPADNLNLRYANGIVAIAEDKIITVDDVRREIGPLVPEIQKQARNEKEFNEKLEALQEDVVQNLIDRVLIVKDFYSDEKRKVPDSYIDNAVAETIITQFDGDRSKFLAYLRSRGISQKDYRKEQEEELKVLNSALERRVKERTLELQASQEQVRRSERLASIGTLAAGIAHEIRNPLNTISLATQYALKSHPDLAPSIKDVLQVVTNEAIRCADIIKNVLLFAKSEQTVKTAHDLNDVVKQVNAIGASPSDLVAILEALKQAGALHAELIVI